MRTSRLPTWLAVVLRHLPLAVAIAASAHQSHRFIKAYSFKLDGTRYYALFDDAMISMRYAWNLVHGHGVVWNPGERVEGFTNPLWMLVMATTLLVFSQAKAVCAVQVIGAVLAGGASFVFARLGGHLMRSSPWPLVALLEAGLYWLISTAFPVRFWSHLGMEVSLLMALSAAAWWLVLRRRRWEHTLTIVGGLAAVALLVRSDGPLVVIPPLVLSLSERRPTVRRLVVAGVPLVLALITTSVARLAYFGDWMPNTYRLKMGQFPFGVRVVQGFSFVQPYLEQVAYFGFLAIIACLIHRSRRALAMFGGALLLVGYQVYVGGDPWTEWRQMTPGYPLLVLLAVSVVATIGLLARRRLRRASLLIRIVAPVLGLGLVACCLAPTRAAFADGGALKFNRDWAVRNTQRALVLNQILKPGGRMAVIWGGVSPYYAHGRWAIDMLGKCDRTVASEKPDFTGKVAWAGMMSVPGHNKTNLEHSLIDMRADYAEDTTWGSAELDPAYRKLFKSYKFGEYNFLLRKRSPNVDWDVVRKLVSETAEKEAAKKAKEAEKQRKEKEAKEAKEAKAAPQPQPPSSQGRRRLHRPLERGRRPTGNARSEQQVRPVVLGGRN